MPDRYRNNSDNVPVGSIVGPLALGFVIGMIVGEYLVRSNDLGARSIVLVISVISGFAILKLVDISAIAGFTLDYGWLYLVGLVLGMTFARGDWRL